MYLKFTTNIWNTKHALCIDKTVGSFVDNNMEWPFSANRTRSSGDVDTISLSLLLLRCRWSHSMSAHIAEACALTVRPPCQRLLINTHHAVSVRSKPLTEAADWCQPIRGALVIYSILCRLFCVSRVKLVCGVCGQRKINL